MVHKKALVPVTVATLTIVFLLTSFEVQAQFFEAATFILSYAQQMG